MWIKTGYEQFKGLGKYDNLPWGYNRKLVHSSGFCFVLKMGEPHGQAVTITAFSSKGLCFKYGATILFFLLFFL